MNEVKDRVYQPWEVLRTWLTPDEYRGYMKGTMIAYLASQGDKDGDLDIFKVAREVLQTDRVVSQLIGRLKKKLSRKGRVGKRR